MKVFHKKLLVLSIGCLMSLSVFAGKPAVQAYATQNSLNTEIQERTSGDNELLSEIINLQNQVNTLQNQVNVLQSKIDNPVPPISYSVGDVLDDGGIVFYVDLSGEHGLAAWPTDEPNNLWAIVKEAAGSHGIKWRLPTKSELELLYEHKRDVPDLQFKGQDIFGHDLAQYWSSTEGNYNASNELYSVWGQVFSEGQQYVFSVKDSFLRGRAVRAF